MLINCIFISVIIYAQRQMFSRKSLNKYILVWYLSILVKAEEASEIGVQLKKWCHTYQRVRFAFSFFAIRFTGANGNPYLARNAKAPGAFPFSLTSAVIPRKRLPVIAAERSWFRFLLCGSYFPTWIPIPRTKRSSKVHRLFTRPFSSHLEIFRIT